MKVFNRQLLTVAALILFTGQALPWGHSVSAEEVFVNPVSKEAVEDSAEAFTNSLADLKQFVPNNAVEVTARKAWTIKTGAIIEDTEENQAFFKLYNPYGEEVDMTVDIEGSTIIVTPTEDYIVGDQYTLYIEGQLPGTLKSGKEVTLDETTYFRFVYEGNEEYALATPENISVDVSLSAVQLTWDEVEGATSYKVYRNGEELTSTEETVFSDLDVIFGDQHTYTIIAENEEGKSAPTEAITAAAGLDTFGPIYTGDYVVISNESLDVENKLDTGALASTHPKASALLAEKPTVPTKIDRTNIIEPKFTSPTEGQRTIDNAKTYKVNDTRIFKTENDVIGGTEEMKATLLATGKNVNVWVADKYFTKKQAEEVAKEYDQNIHTFVTKNFAPASDIDSNGKVEILFFDIQDGYDGEEITNYTGGYFYSGDQDPVSETENSNEADIIYLDTYPALGEDGQYDHKASYLTIVHELQHLVNYNQERNVELDKETGLWAGSATWLDEGLALASEQMYNEVSGAEVTLLEDRISTYNTSPTIANGHSLLVWGDNEDDLSNYSLSYLFFQYIKVQAGQGNGIFKEILQYNYLTDGSEEVEGEDLEEQYSNLQNREAYAAIEHVIHKYIDEDMSFGEFMTAFRIALVAQQDDGLYGLKGEITGLEIPVFKGSQASLKGGASIIVPATNQAFDAFDVADDLRYVGIYK